MNASVSRLLPRWGGKVWAAEWIDAANDAAALASARGFSKAVHCEVWQGQRLIGRVDPDRSPTEEPADEG